MVLCGSTSLAKEPASFDRMNRQQARNYLVQLINIDRRKNGLAPVALDAMASKAGQLAPPLVQSRNSSTSMAISAKSLRERIAALVSEYPAHSHRVSRLKALMFFTKIFPDQCLLRQSMQPIHTSCRTRELRQFFLTRWRSAVTDSAPLLM
jgi:hypothetical protein